MIINNNDNFYQEQQATAESKKKGERMFKGKAVSDFIVFTLILSYVYLWHAIGIVYSIDLLIGYTLATLVSYVVIYKGTSYLFEKNKNSNKTKRKFLLDKEEVDKVHSYEEFSKIESDIIDHLIKVLNTFKLEPFQYKYKLNNKKGEQI